ncbi:Dabb family protein [Marinomonas sp. C2222]|uniref:Dabb family protein n=1 Tax=Marinomonas sargassi TaxID=2984494 RepID=A0ABT2YRD0_9GAMM|nr:Dabb family protein [Marinomonas sargassi]MCV2402426.1 Dabb family protein [Marinomonas sargassi]
MIRHILLIKFNARATKANIEELKELFESITEKIQGVVSVEWGTNNSPEGLNKDYTHSVVMTFLNEEARQDYLPHKEHDSLKAVFVPLLEDIIVFDYEA